MFQDCFQNQQIWAKIDPPEEKKKSNFPNPHKILGYKNILLRLLLGFSYLISSSRNKPRSSCPIWIKWLPLNLSYVKQDIEGNVEGNLGSMRTIRVIKTRQADESKIFPLILEPT